MDEKKYLKWYQKVAYGSGDLASNCSYGLVSSFLLLYLSDVMGLNTGIIGTLMLVSKIFDGVTDVFFGNMIDRTKSRLGKARPWMLYAQIGVSLCLVLLFSIPNMGQTAQYAYFFAFYTCLNAIFYTANGVAYATLSALITNNAQERVQLGSIRFMFAVVTNIVMGFAVTGGVEAFGGGASGWRAVAIICAVIGLVVNTISCLAVKEVEPEELAAVSQPEDKPQDDQIGFWDSMKLLFTNKYYILILVLYIVYYVMSNITTGSGVYFTKYVLGNASLLGMFQMMKMFPVIIALIFTPMLVKKAKSMQKVNFWGYFINCMLSIPFVYFAYVKNVKLMLLFMFIKGIFAGTLTGTLNALIAEISGYTYRTKGVRMDGTMFSCSSLGIKIGGGIGTAAVGWLLDLGGYIGTATTQTDGAINMIFAMYIVIPVIFSVIITLILGFLNVEKANRKWDEEHSIKEA